MWEVFLDLNLISELSILCKTEGQWHSTEMPHHCVYKCFQLGHLQKHLSLLKTSLYHKILSCFTCLIPYIWAFHCNTSRFYDCWHSKRCDLLLSILLTNSRMVWASLQHCHRMCYHCLFFLRVCGKGWKITKNSPLHSLLASASFSDFLS